MLTKITLKNFKCFRDTICIPLGLMNLLTGVNGRGKSTVLQALLLMRQSPEHSRTTNQIIFNGSCVELGSFDDVRNRQVSRNEAIELQFRFQTGDSYADLCYCLYENDQDDMVARIDSLRVESQVDGKDLTIQVTPEDDWRNLLFDSRDRQDQPYLFIGETVNFANIHYVSANRIGPQDYYPKQSFAEFPNVGHKGEYTANLLSKKKDELVYGQLCLETDETNTVLDQTQAWLGNVFDGARIDIKTTDANIVLMSLNSENSVERYKPINVGFGYSYALPIIVSGLIAKRGEFLIVENPEAHLHPYAQSQITKFLAKVSKCGVQVFIESHSDHVLNALRVAVLDHIIESDELNVLYFDRDEEGTHAITIPVQPDGSIEHWPQGFFDQIDRDFERLFGV